MGDKRKEHKKEGMLVRSENMKISLEQLSKFIKLKLHNGWVTSSQINQKPILNIK